MPSNEARGVIDERRYFLLDGSRNVTGPTTIANTTAASDVLTLRGAASQSGDIFVVQDSASTDMFTIGATGKHTHVVNLPTDLSAVSTTTIADRRTVTLAVNAGSTDPNDYGTTYLRRMVATQASNATLNTLYMQSSSVTLSGKYLYLYGDNQFVVGNSASASSELTTYYGTARHTGAGLLSFLAGIQFYSLSTGPTTDHTNALFDATNSAAAGSLTGVRGSVSNTGTISGTMYGGRFTATQTSGSVANIIGLDVTVSGTASSSKHAIRTNGGGLSVDGDIVLNGTAKIVGGTGTTSDLILQTTSGVGITGADMLFRVGNNGATTAMYILNNGNIGVRESNPRSHLSIGDDNGYAGGLFVRSVSGSIANFGAAFEITSGINPTATGQGIRVDGSTRRIQFLLSSTITLDTEVFEIDTVNSASIFNGPTSGVYTFVRYADQAEFKPTSGTASFAWIKLNGLVNQTGGASGITRGLWINTDITAAADWRSVEITPNTGYSVYQSGASAVNYFNGNVGVKTLVPNNALDVTGTVQADGLRLDVTPTAETISPTHTITISINGTNYKVPIALA